MLRPPLTPPTQGEKQLPLSDPIHRPDEFLVGEDSVPSHQIENQRDGRQYSWPLRNEIHRPPRLIVNGLRHHEETDIPSYNQQGIKRTEERLYLPVSEDKDGIGAKSGRRQQDGEERLHIKVPMSQRISEP